MDIGKYKLAMRPKKYLDGKFVIYDSSLPDASDAQLETREMFGKGGGRFQGVEGTPSRVQFDTDKQLYRKMVQETVDGVKKNKYIYSEPGESLEQFMGRKPIRSTGADDATVKARQFIDNWTKNWFDENLKNYDVKNFDEMLSKLSNDWEIALESENVPKGSRNFKLKTSELGLPNITTLADAKIKSDLTPFEYNGVRFYKNLEGDPTQLGKTLAQYKKVFYKNQIENNPELRKDLNKFFDFMSSDKRGQYKKLDGKTIKQFMDTEVSDDVKFLLNDKTSGLGKDSKFEVFNSYDDLADNYNTFTQDKARLKAVQIESESMSKVGEKTKNQYLKVKESIKNQNDVLAKMSVEDIAKNKKLLNSVRMVINPISGEVSYTNYTVNDPKGKPALDDMELAKKIKQKALDGNFFVTEHISKKSLEKLNTAFPNNLQSANYMSNVQLENARSFLSNSQNRVTEAAQNLDKALEQTGLTIRGPEYGGQRYGNKMDIIFNSNTGRSNIVDNQSIDIKGTRQSQIENLLNIEGVQKASEMPRPASAIQSEMFTKATQRWNQQEVNELLNSFCDVQKKAGGTGSLACGIKEIEKNLFKEGRQALKTGVKTSRLARLGQFMTGFVGAVDVPIELAFAAPHILRGDKDAAKKAMIIGLFGAGRDKVQRANEELGKDSATSKIYKYEKALEDFAEVYTDVVNAKKTLQREDIDKVPQKIQDTALESLQGGIERLKEIKDIVNNYEPNIQEKSKSKAELIDLQKKGTLDSNDFTYLGQALSDPLSYYNESLSGLIPEFKGYEGEDISRPTDFVEAQGDQMYPYMKEQEYLSEAVEDAFTGFTGKDILDRYSDVKIEDLNKLAQAEKEYLEKFLLQEANRIGPKAVLKLAEEQGLDPSVLQYKFPVGYLERQGFSKGGMGRRDFLKLLGTVFGTIGAAKAGLLKFAGKKVAKQVITTPPAVGKPEWFDALVNKVINEGMDVTKQFATKEREIVHAAKINEEEGVRVIRDLEDGSIRVEYDSPTNMGQETVRMQYKIRTPDETYGGKLDPGEFETIEAEPQWVGGPEDTDIEMLSESGGPGIEFLESDVSNLKAYATGKKLSKEELEKRAKRVNLTTKVSEDQYEAAEFLGGKYGDGPEPPDDWNPGE